MLTKEDRFSAASPLSQENKKFLLTFLSGSEERVLSDEYMSRDQHKVIEAKTKTTFLDEIELSEDSRAIGQTN